MLPRLSVSANPLRLLSSEYMQLHFFGDESAMIRADLISELVLGYYLAYHVFLLPDETSAVQRKKYFIANFMEYLDALCRYCYRRIAF